MRPSGGVRRPLPSVPSRARFGTWPGPPARPRGPPSWQAAERRAALAGDRGSSFRPRLRWRCWWRAGRGSCSTRRDAEPAGTEGRDEDRGAALAVGERVGTRIAWTAVLAVGEQSGTLAELEGMGGDGSTGSADLATGERASLG